MNSGVAQRKLPASANFFRADWTYRRVPAGDAMLAAGRGMSPAFFALLGLIGPGQSVSFGELGQSLAWLHADDLELWLAELCRMGLIEPGSDAPAAASSRLEQSMVRPQPRAEAQFEVSSQHPGAVASATQAENFGTDWKRVSLDSLYTELLAICNELQAREQQPAALAV